VIGRGQAANNSPNAATTMAAKVSQPTAVINGVLAPPLILIVVLLTGDRTVMGHAVNSRVVSFLGNENRAVQSGK
jgi:Mn2+/Fe2+ NRAMP family transporter